MPKTYSLTWTRLCVTLLRFSVNAGAVRAAVFGYGVGAGAVFVLLSSAASHGAAGVRGIVRPTSVHYTQKRVNFDCCG